MSFKNGDIVYWNRASATRTFTVIGQRVLDSLVIQDEHGEFYRVMITELYPKEESNG